MIFPELFFTFFKIGLFTFGGGYAMIPLIQSEILSKGWLGGTELIDFLAISESTPGPFAVNISTYIGSVLCEDYGISGRIAGAACATLGVVLPSFIIILIVAKFYFKFKENRVIAGAMTGIRPCSVALIMTAIVLMASSVFFPDGFSLDSITEYGFVASFVIFVLMLVLMRTKKKIHPIAIVGISALLGIAQGLLSEII